MSMDDDVCDSNELGLIVDASGFQAPMLSLPSHCSPPSSYSHLISVQGSAPVLLVEHKLAIQFWAVKYIVNTALPWIQACARHWQYNVQRLPGSFSSHLLCATRCLLLLNPDNYTCWNLRKKLFTQANSTSISMQALDESNNTPPPPPSSHFPRQFCHPLHLQAGLCCQNCSWLSY